MRSYPFPLIDDEGGLREVLHRARVVEVQVGHDHGRDLARAHPAIEQLPSDGLLRREAEGEGTAELAELLAGTVSDALVQAGVDQDIPGARVLDQERGDRYPPPGAPASVQAEPPRSREGAGRLVHVALRRAHLTAHQRVQPDAGIAAAAGEREPDGGGVRGTHGGESNLTRLMEALFRDGLLAGQVIVTAGPCGGVAERLTTLGSPPHSLELGDEEDAAREATERIASASEGRIDTLVVDGAAAGDPPEGIDRVWIAIRAVATAAMIEGGRGGKVVILAPRPDEGAHAEAIRSALENVARTLSIEWARFNIRLTAIAPGPGEAQESVAALVAYLASPAGDYFSGSRLSLA